MASFLKFLILVRYAPEVYGVVISLIILLIAIYIWGNSFFNEFLADRSLRVSRVVTKTASIPEAAGVLEQYFPYYKALNQSAQKKFLKRLELFMALKEFIPRQTAKNETVNILIGATAVQLSFGLDTFAFFSFKKILIYPDAYYSTIRETYHKGEINVPMRLIVLSAKHFLEGVIDPTDGVNLGLHEMAHAMQVHHFDNYNASFISAFREWERVAIPEMQNVSQKPNHFLRRYAMTNIPEMFAVCVENFFERPYQFQQALPLVYERLKMLLNQDPLNVRNPAENDFR